jgi:formate/nitrite transporter FocA (FNT family)
MLIKLLILAMLAAVLVALGSAVFALLGPQRERTRMARALTWRIGLSVTLFLLLMVGFATGLIKPHAVAAPTPATHSQ